MKDLVNPNVLDLVPYKPGKPTEELRREHNLRRVVKLASNENPFQVPRNVVEAVEKEIANFNLYPENDCFYLRHQIAKINGVDADNIIMGAGSVELIRIIAVTFLKPGQTVLSSEKTFLMYRIAATEIGGKSAIVEAPMGDDYTYDLDALYRLVDENTKIIFIANPNNPTGTMLPKQALIDFINNIPDDKFVVLDNAYQEYVRNAEAYFDGIKEAVNRKNLIILRTFSKIYSLSGLRVGYGVADAEVIAYLNRVKPPFNVTRPAQVAARASLENDEFRDRSAAFNVKAREKLIEQLRAMDLQVIPSEANFLCFFPRCDVADLNERLLREGVIIRPLQAFGVPDAMRVSVGLEEDNDYFIERLKKVLSEM